MQRSTLILLALLTLTACFPNDTVKPVPETLQSPVGEIEVGVGLRRTVRLQANGSLEVARGEALGYPLIEGRAPDHIELGDAKDITVEKAVCDATGCSITYTQDRLSDFAFFFYAIIDQSGQRWMRGSLSGKLQQPTLEGHSFDVVLGERIKTLIPVRNRNATPLTDAPQVQNFVATGGTVESFTCDQQNCQIEFLYKDATSTPGLAVTFASSTSSMSSDALSASAEKITYRNLTKDAYGNPAQIRLVYGVDYESSWKRPARSITVRSRYDLGPLSFDCSQDICLGNALLQDFEEPEFTYSVNADTSSTHGVVTLHQVHPLIQSLIQDVTVSNGVDTDISFAPGTAYTTGTGAWATDIKVETPSWNLSGLSVTSKGCNATGLCTLTVKLVDNAAFKSFEYSLRIGNFVGPHQTLKVIPRLRGSTDGFHIWNKADKNAWNELVLRPDVDYTAIDRGKATGISVTRSDSMEFKDQNPFTCDAEGVCRASVRWASRFIPGRLQFTVQTPTEKSGLIDRAIYFDADIFNWSSADTLAPIVGRDGAARFEGFQLQLRPGIDYDSHFPARRVQIETFESDMSFPGFVAVDHWTYEGTCEAEGTCSIEGFYPLRDTALDYHVRVLNDYGMSSFKSGRVIPKAYGSFLINTTKTDAQPISGEDFTVTLDFGEHKGYSGESLAARVEVTLSGGLAATPYPCIDGRCTFPIRATGIEDSVSVQLFDNEGHASLKESLRVVYPQPLAISRVQDVPDDARQLSLKLPVESTGLGHSIEIDPIEGVDVKVSVSDTQNYQLDMTVRNPLIVDAAPLVLRYRITSGDKISNTATLTLKAKPVLSLKPQTTVTATLQSDAYQFTLNYSEHFNVMAGTPDLAEYFSKNFRLEFAANTKVVASTVSCDASTASCLVSLTKAIDPSVKTITGTFNLGPRSNAFRPFVKESPITINLN